MTFCAEAGVVLESPRDYEVVQRVKGVADVPVLLKGVEGRECSVAILGPDKAEIARQELAVERGKAQGVFKAIPQGGWYEALVAGKRLGRFGVGDVYVVAGQSNAAGYGDGFVPDRSGLVSVRKADGVHWKLAQSPEELPAGMERGSPWPILGELLVRAGGVPIGFINVAVGGTGTNQWLPAAGTLYVPLREALAAQRVRAVLWHQGESDALPTFNEEQTRQNMEALITQSRKDAGWEVPWYVARASYRPDAAPEEMEAVRNAQKAIWDSGLAYPGPDTDLYVPDSMRYDRLHFNQVGLRVHAILWFISLWEQ